jgi:RNA 2',3'-cyclic 3'-phosphodiesterase
MSPRSAARSYRLFVAVYPPAEIVAQLLAALARLDLPAHRITPAAQVHLTLQFIGDRAARELPTVTESAERALAGIGPIEVRIARLISLPHNAAPRLFAAEADEHTLLSEAHKRLARRLASPGRASEEKFLPHFTLARFAPRAAEVGAHTIRADLAPISFTLQDALLMASVLHPSGAEHRELARITL